MAAPSRTIRFVAKEDGKVHYGEVVQSGDIGLLYRSQSLITARILSDSPLSPSCAVTSSIRTVQRLLAPLHRDEIKTIRGLGAQYAAPGALVVKPEVAVLFYKPVTTICGPGDPIVIPAQARGEKTDYEVELCAVLGKDARDVSVEDALSYVMGYTTVNDVSSRGLCGKGAQWGFGKSYDSWCPLGPVLVAANAIRDPQNLDIKTTVNGILKQKSNTSAMILSLAELISRMSHGVTLEAGSIILTGTPLPLDRENDKDPWLKHGDVVAVTVEGCGTLINTVVEEGGTLGLAKL